jgi:amino acid transporter
VAEPLRRSLNLVQLCFYGVGTMVGAGIYSVIGVAAGEVGANLWIAFVAAGAAALLTALSYAELVSLVHRAGAEYQFVRLAFPKWRALAFVAGYLIALNASATAATVSLAFAGYLRVFFDVPAIVTAFGLLAACTAVNLAGIREATWLGMALIGVEVSGLVAVVAIGAFAGDFGRVFEAGPAVTDVAAIFRVAALVFFVFVGFEDVANLAEETHSPERDVPRALLISVGLTSALYVAVALAVVALAPPAELAASDSPLRVAVISAVPAAGPAVAVAALVATASTALIALVSISRLLFGMARDGDMPALLARTWTARQTPWTAALALFAAATLLLPLGSVKILASVSSLGVLLVFTGVHAALIRLRLTSPATPRRFRVPGPAPRGVPLLPALGLAISLALATQFEPKVYAVAGAALAIGFAIYKLR